MGRHRSDPMGLARISIAALAITLALGLLIVGGTMLWGAWTKDSSRSQAASSPSGPGSTDSGSGSAPPGSPGGNTVAIKCVAAECPGVFVSGPGPNDVQYNGKLSRDEQRIFSATRLTVAVDDASTVIVTINGHQQPRGHHGESRTYAVPQAR